MGRQINFYFDVREELEFLREALPVGVRLYAIRVLRTPELNEFTLLSAVQWRKNAPLQLAIIDDSHRGMQKYFRIAEKHFSINLLESCAIEFSRPQYIADIPRLVPGRLWYEQKYWSTDVEGNDVQIEKAEELKKLYESLARWIRKRCKRLPNGLYIAPGAQKLADAGAELM